jgi:hypothetical protein
VLGRALTALERTPPADPHGASSRDASTISCSGRLRSDEDDDVDCLARRTLPFEP